MWPSNQIASFGRKPGVEHATLDQVEPCIPHLREYQADSSWYVVMPDNEPAWTSETLVAPHRLPDKSARVRRMFNGIARRYELINTLFSAGRDSSWRRKAARLVQVHADDVVLDIACGTGDFSRTFASSGVQTVVGLDFAHEMLRRGVDRHTTRTNANQIGRWCEADALHLPFPQASFSLTACAFGVRNFADLDAGLAEMHRVLTPSGRVVILEFTTPTNRLLRSLYSLYSHRLMPIAATLISGDRGGAYRYLPRSVVSFHTAEQMCERLSHAGFSRVSATPLSMGIVTVYVAWRNES